ncbi:YdeI family protein [Roseivirga sp. BDSF3-8]|uniref:YdeI/OmpD-associated family protein n=1 Tax=Roseivirga sp. BDSF3-8 TaxID=3241598 RepID=UPI003531ABCD
MIKTENFEKVEVTSAGELRDWLSKHYAQDYSVWLVTYKKVKPAKYISTGQILNELLCFGWIDGIRRKLDEDRTMQFISPRKSEHWAKTYKQRAAKLMEQGRMHDAGLKSIEASKASGLWDFMNDVDNLVIPTDLQKALKKYPEAETFFHNINDSSKRFVLRWIKLAKKEETRQARMEKIAQLSARGEKLPGS